MGEQTFYWIGVGVVSTLAVAATIIALFMLYAWAIHDRFGLIFFRKTERRLSIASWHRAKLLTDEHFAADDFPVNERPFCLTYKVGQRRLFILAGFLSPHRHMPIKGTPPPTPSPDVQE